MASLVDIANLALSHIGESVVVTSVSPPDGSAASRACARMYPLARGSLLEAVNWTFATKRAVPAELVSTTTRWVYAYQLPSDCLRVITAYTAGGSDEDGELFETEGEVLYTNNAIDEIRYIFDQTDTTKLSPLAVEALSWKLASLIAGPLTRSTELKSWAEQNYIATKGAAATADAGQRMQRRQPDPVWITNR